jgi:hypothetical protein
MASVLPPGSPLPDESKPASANPGMTVDTVAFGFLGIVRSYEEEAEMTLGRSDTKATVLGREVLLTEGFSPVFITLLFTLVLTREVGSIFRLVSPPTTVPAVQRDLRPINWAQLTGNMVVR